MTAFLGRFRSAPIRYQVAIRTFALGTLLVALAVQATVNSSEDGLRRQFDDHTGALIDVVADLSRAPLLTDEYAQHNGQLLRLTNDKDVHILDVLDLSGQIVSSSDQSRIGLHESAIEDFAEDAQHPILSRPVVAVSGELGSVRLVLDETAIDSQLGSERRQGLVSGVIGVAVLALFSLLGGWATTRRISDLESQLGNLGEDGVPVPVRSRGNDEIARLGAVLNERTERIRLVVAANAQAHANLQVSEKKLQLALAATADAVVEVDLAAGELTIVGANTTGTRMNRLASATMAEIKNLVHPDDKGVVKSAVAAVILSKEPTELVEVEVRVRYDSRGWRNIVLRIQSTAGLNESTGRVLVAIVDVTEQRQRERSLAQKDKMQAIGKLTTGIVHDFNNALAVSRLQLSVLGRVDRDRTRDDERIQQLIATNTNSTEMVRGLLLSASPQSTRSTTVDIVEYLEALSGLLRTSLGPDVTLTLDLLEANGFVDIDKSAMQRVFLNLSKNALDAMQGSGQMTIRSWNPTARTVAIQVDDTGPGIDRSVADTLFEAFVTTKGLGAGTGLGLATAFETLTAAGGTIVASNNVDGGASFTVTLPLATEPDAAALDAVPAGAGAHGTRVDFTGADGIGADGIQAKRILLVDDNAALLHSLTELLVDAGYKLSQAGCVIDAMQVVAESDRIDLILTDILLPDGSGFDLRTSANGANARIPTLFMSAYLGDQDLDRIDGSTFLQKPFDDAAALAAIAAALRPEVSLP